MKASTLRTWLKKQHDAGNLCDAGTRAALAALKGRKSATLKDFIDFDEETVYCPLGYVLPGELLATQADLKRLEHYAIWVMEATFVLRGRPRRVFVPLNVTLRVPEARGRVTVVREGVRRRMSCVLGNGGKEVVQCYDEATYDVPPEGLTVRFT